MVYFPSREGIEGCVTVRGAVRDEVLWESVSGSLVLRGSICRLRVDVFDFRQLCADVTHPPPLSRGEF